MKKKEKKKYTRNDLICMKDIKIIINLCILRKRDIVEG